MRLFAVPALADNYIWVAADDGGHALAVDPGEAAPLEALLQREGLALTALLLTHHHPDHIAGAAELAQRHPGLRILAPDDDRIAVPGERVHDGQQIELMAPKARFQVLAVPGHTRSHVAYAGEGLLFCGDTLFSLGCGRLFEGTPAQMLESLERLAGLAGETQVCCGHEYTVANAAFARAVDPHNGALLQRLAEAQALRAEGRPSVPSTLAGERAANPFLRIDAPALRDWARRHAPDAVDRVERFAALRTAKDSFRA
ncbi:MAG TPA: hydroxyacylglutathione hydrolase [Rhodanobacteraceae bacterium]|nr:hydroxyacylglutathione hydrolase [Rhodanobacteraceae bacterium]